MDLRSTRSVEQLLRKPIRSPAAFAAFYMIDYATRGNVIEGNYVGTNASGATNLGVGGSAITFNNTPFNTLGGSTTGFTQRHFGQCRKQRVYIYDSGAHSNVVQGNYIGVAPNELLRSVTQSVSAWSQRAVTRLADRQLVREM